MAINMPMLRTMMLHSKASMLGESSLSPGPKLHHLLMHRALEKTIFGDITNTPGEQDFLSTMQQSMPNRAAIEGKIPKGS